ncbi:MAG: hypothetical protein JWM78_3510 [Verrucomicrobiaceae bacterium]|nr:hypothetical protein [Verrucomicrobiaceae bacterium]
MNIQYKFPRKIAIYVFVIFCFPFFVVVAQAQPKPPTQKELDVLDAALKKIQASEKNGALKNFPTPAQSEAFKKIGDWNTQKYELLNPEFYKLSKKIEQDTNSPGFQLTKAHLQAAMTNHKMLRALYEEHLNAVGGWGRQSGRMDCVRQAEKTRLYMRRVSDQWLRKVAVLPLSKVEDRLYAAQYIGAGGGETFHLGLEPSGDTRYWVNTEQIGLAAVCIGGKEEYVPGTE